MTVTGCVSFVASGSLRVAWSRGTLGLPKRGRLIVKRLVEGLREFSLARTVSWPSGSTTVGGVVVFEGTGGIWGTSSSIEDGIDALRGPGVGGGVDVVKLGFRLDRVSEGIG